jgi:hypothetical protein
VGINRYTKFSDLTDEERKYLVLQGTLSRLNLLDPNLFGLRSFSVANWRGQSVRINANMRHWLTASGYALDLNLFTRNGDRRFFTTLRLYRNHDRIFPGVDAEIPAPMFGVRDGLVVSPRLALWIQPDGQRFVTRQGAVGGLMAARIIRRLTERGAAFLELTAKTAGWTPGESSLDRSVAVRSGFVLRGFANR